MDISERRQKVAKLFFKGHTNADICKEENLSPKQVSEDIKVIRKQLEPKTIRAIEYYRNKTRGHLDLIRKKAWGIVEGNAPDTTKVSALRVIKEVEELSTKVDGIVTDKMPPGPDKKAEELAKRLIEIARGDNGHKEGELKNVNADNRTTAVDS